MSVSSWLLKRPNRNLGSPTRRGTFRPRLEVLEGRSLPSFGFAATAPAGDAVATDAAGNVYVAGGNSVAKYSPTGALQWSATMGVDNRGIAVDTGGNVFIAGTYTTTATFGATTLTTTQDDAYTAKLDTDGNVVWARGGLTTAGKPVDVSSGARVAVDAAGNAYVVDAVMSGPLFDETHIFRLDGGTGATQWTARLAGLSSKNTSIPGSTEMPVIAANGTGVYVAGTFFATVDFDPGPGTYQLYSSNPVGYVLKLTTGGAFAWASAFVGSGSMPQCTPNGVAANTAGNVYVSGTFSGSVDFDPSGGKRILKSISGPIFVTKLTAAGGLAWAKQFGAGTDPFAAGARSGLVASQAAGSIAVDGAGDVYVTGAFTGTTNFNPAGGGTMTSAAGADAYVVKLNAAGVFQWAVRAGGTGGDHGSGIVVDASGNINVVGRIDAGTVDFDPDNTWLDDRDLLTGPTAFLWQITQP